MAGREPRILFQSGLDLRERIDEVARQQLGRLLVFIQQRAILGRYGYAPTVGHGHGNSSRFRTDLQVPQL